MRALVRPFPLALAACAAIEPPPPAANGVEALPTKELAGRLLPAELAARVVSHEVHKAEFPMPASVSFFARPVPRGDGACVRERYAASLPPPGDEPSSVAIHLEEALAPGCALPAKGRFASVRPAHRLDEAVAALRHLAAARAAAAGKRPLPFELTCRTFNAPGECPGGARGALAALPVETAYIIEPGRADGWRVAVVPTGPGQLYWNVRIEEGGGGHPRAIRLSWEPPPPF